MSNTKQKESGFALDLDLVTILYCLDYVLHILREVG